MKKDIYVITNLITGLQYVGQSKDAYKRFKAHSRAADNTILHQAIRVYGIENFVIEILESQIEDFNDKEQYWIEKLHTLYPDGYNMTAGGEGYPHLNGELCYQSKLSQDKVEQIKTLLEDTNLTQEKIAIQFDVTQEIISNINVGRTYYNNNWNYPLRKNDELALRAQGIKDKLKNTTLSAHSIANIYGVCKSTVLGINNGTLYQDSKENYPIRVLKRGLLDDTKILLEIKKHLEESILTTEEIAALYHVQRGTIEKINNGKTYFNVLWDYPLRKKIATKKGLTPEQLAEIEDLLINTDMSFRGIAKRVGIKSHSTVSNINSGFSKRYRNPNKTYPLRRHY